MVDEETDLEVDIEEPIDDIVRNDEAFPAVTGKSCDWNADSIPKVQFPPSHALVLRESRDRRRTGLTQQSFLLMTFESHAGREESLDDWPSFGEGDVVDESDIRFPTWSWNVGVKDDKCLSIINS